MRAMGGRASYACILVGAALATGCAPRITHRNFIPTDGSRTVRTPGEPAIPGQRHVLPKNAVDERTAVLVYTTGGYLAEDGRNAFIEVVFRGRNDEPQPMSLQPHDTLLVLGANRRRTRTFLPIAVERDSGEALPEGQELVLAPKSAEQWTVIFALPEGDNPLYDVRTFLVSWIYRMGGEPYEEQTSFASRRPRTRGWVFLPKPSSASPSTSSLTVIP